VDSRTEPRVVEPPRGSPGPLPEAECAELEGLRERLRARESVTWFTRGGVLVLVGIILFGVSSRLFADSLLAPVWAAGLGSVVAFALGLVVAGLAWLRRGQAQRQREHAAFQRFIELRRRAGFD
jgi:hypothetical protein